MHIYTWIYVTFVVPLSLSKATLQAERRRKAMPLPQPSDSCSSCCSCGYGLSRRTHSHCPYPAPMPAGTKDLCLTGSHWPLLALPPRLFGIIFYDSILSSMTHSHVLGTSQEYQVHRH